MTSDDKNADAITLEGGAEVLSLEKQQDDFVRDLALAEPLLIASSTELRGAATALVAAAVLPATTSPSLLAAAALESATSSAAGTGAGTGAAAAGTSLSATSAAPAAAPLVAKVLSSAAIKGAVLATLAVGGGAALLANNGGFAGSSSGSAASSSSITRSTPLNGVSSLPPSLPSSSLVPSSSLPIASNPAAKNAVSPNVISQELQPRAPGDASSVTDRRSAPAPSRSAKPQPSVSEQTNRTQPQRNEIELLTEARGASRSNPYHSLELANEHRRLYPQSGHSQEREMIRITALVTLGRHFEAQVAADSFKQQYPNSPYLRRLSKIVGTK